MDINLLIEPRGSESPASKKSSTSIGSASTAATRAYTTAPSAYTQSPAYATTSPAYAAASPAYGPTPAYSAPGPAPSMQGGPVLPAISELQRHQDPGQHPQFRPLYTGPPASSAPAPGPQGSNGSPPSRLIKRAASQTPLPEESPAKKQSKWTPEEDNLTIELRGQGMKWDDIAKRLPGRSSISCRLRYQNYLEKRAVWDEEKKNKLARLYARYVASQPPSLAVPPILKNRGVCEFVWSYISTSLNSASEYSGLVWPLFCPNSGHYSLCSVCKLYRCTGFLPVRHG